MAKLPAGCLKSNNFCNALVRIARTLPLAAKSCEPFSSSAAKDFFAVTLRQPYSKLAAGFSFSKGEDAVSVEKDMYLTPPQGSKVNWPFPELFCGFCSPSDFAYFTAEYRLLPNQKKACFFPILDIFSQPEDFIGIYSQIQKAQAVSKKGNKITATPEEFRAVI